MQTSLFSQFEEEKNLEKKKSNIFEFSVSEFSNAIKRLVEDAFGYVKIKGEISGLKKATSGHVYFNLKDENSLISAVCFKAAFSKVNFDIEDGMEVVLSGKVTTYAGRSNYQIIVEKIEIAGIGALLEIIEKRKKALEKEGLFEKIHKKKLPFFPKKIAIITSKTGAVIEDIKNRISERFPTHLQIYSISVQGKSAAFEAILALNYFENLSNNKKPDLIIIARGGGSIEDLLPFNDEELVRKVFACQIPIISAIGHETDFTILDYVSDIRAATPSAAAEIATPLLFELKEKISTIDSQIKYLIKNNLFFKEENFVNFSKFIISPQKFFAEIQSKISNLSKRFESEIRNKIEASKVKLSSLFISKNHLENIIVSNQEKLIFFSKNLEKYCDIKLYEKNLIFTNLSKNLKNNDYKEILKRGFSILKDKNNNIISLKEDFLDEKNNSFKIELFNGQINAKLAKEND